MRGAAKRGMKKAADRPIRRLIDNRHASFAEALYMRRFCAHMPPSLPARRNVIDSEKRRYTGIRQKRAQRSLIIILKETQNDILAVTANRSIASRIGRRREPGIFHQGGTHL